MESVQQIKMVTKTNYCPFLSNESKCVYQMLSWFFQKGRHDDLIYAQFWLFVWRKSTKFETKRKCGKQIHHRLNQAIKQNIRSNSHSNSHSLCPNIITMVQIHAQKWNCILETTHFFLNQSEFWLFFGFSRIRSNYFQSATYLLPIYIAQSRQLKNVPNTCKWMCVFFVQMIALLWLKPKNPNSFYWTRFDFTKEAKLIEIAFNDFVVQVVSWNLHG